MIELLVVGEHRAVFDRQAVLKVVVDDGHHSVDVSACPVQVGAAIERSQIATRSKRCCGIEPCRRRRCCTSRLRRIAPVGGPQVVKIFVAQPDLGGVVRLVRHRRIDAVAFQKVVIPEAVACLIHHVQARGPIVVDGLAGIHSYALVVPGAGLDTGLVDTLAVGLLQRAIERATTHAATECDRARPFENFNALSVVHIAEDLHVVAKAVYEEVRTRIHTTND